MKNIEEEERERERERNQVSLSAELIKKFYYLYTVETTNKLQKQGLENLNKNCNPLKTATGTTIKTFPLEKFLMLIDFI